MTAVVAVSLLVVSVIGWRRVIRPLLRSMALHREIQEMQGELPRDSPPPNAGPKS
jgi:hypothetical protein